ncbi:HAMP domain-containing sensor histidine kinase [Streptomyces massasporeus]|uniref:HAMP domain-containing sensor histidine kinase n=1 Tax=Streptomyces massasporeus TaxID=67324 RepID=UPI0019BC5BBC|nr:HAMP domain-containing sensor histidine kinase [Streptomyces massasporeus]GGV90356.1 histidine kinase [Streptomyces massasporeus]
MPLFRRIFLLNALVLIANARLLRVGLAPLHLLTRAMTTIDLLRPGQRPAVGGQGEVAELITTFNTMVDRLEEERAASSARVLSAQEAERRRVAQELHDEVGQTLTAVLLELERVAGQAPPGLREEMRQVQETTRAGLDEVRRIARRLRPGVLDELGLASALKSLATDFGAPGLSVRHRLDADLPPLDREAEVVLYRVAQEGLTNVARHARARHAEIVLRRTHTGVELYVRDDGHGTGDAAEGAGIRGMRERALLVGAGLALVPGPGGGTEVRLTVPVPTPVHDPDRNGRS